MNKYFISTWKRFLKSISYRIEKIHLKFNTRGIVLKYILKNIIFLFLHLYLKYGKLFFYRSPRARDVALLFFLQSVNRSEISGQGIRDLSSVTEYVPYPRTRFKDDNPTRTAVDLNWIRSRKRKRGRGPPLFFPPTVHIFPRLSLRACPYVSYFENRMITRLRSRFPALPAPASVKSKVNIYYRERFPWRHSSVAVLA